MRGSAPELLSDVIWDDYPLAAEVRALLIFEQADRPGVLVLARAMSDGSVYGVREIQAGSDSADAILAAWVKEAQVEGLSVVDMRRPADSEA